MSTKILEQEWTWSTEPYGAGTRVLVRWGGRTVCHFPSFDPKSAAIRNEAARFVAAAPNMARVLVEVRDAIVSRTLSEDAPEVIERVLRKAGVL
jgi:hypothetical protein